MSLFLLFRLTAFHRKTDAYLIALILNAEGSEIKGFGFSFLNSSPRVLRGIQGFVAIFCYPNDLVVSFNVSMGVYHHSRLTTNCELSPQLGRSLIQIKKMQKIKIHR